MMSQNYSPGAAPRGFSPQPYGPSAPPASPYAPPAGQPYGAGGPGPNAAQRSPFGSPGGYSGPVPASVNIASILLFVGGGFGLLGALWLLAWGSFIAVFAVIGVVLLAVAAAEIFVGLQLRKLQPWARTATIVLAGLAALFNVISLFHGAFSSIIGVALDAYVIYLMYRPDTLQAFPQSTRPGGI